MPLSREGGSLELGFHVKRDGETAPAVDSRPLELQHTRAEWRLIAHEHAVPANPYLSALRCCLCGLDVRAAVHQTRVP